MALIDGEAQFDADQLHNAVIGVAAEVGSHDSGMHHHKKAQLLYAPKGCMNITLDTMHCVLPPTRAAWIPANTPHCVRMTNVVAYRSLYFDLSRNGPLPGRISIFCVSGLMRELIERMAFWPWDISEDKQRNTRALFCEELSLAKTEALQLPLPRDKRLSGWLSSLNHPDALPDPLNQLANRVGASSKTITRLFNKETGMSYQSWRQQWRLLKSIEKLSEGLSVNDVAYALEFSSDSAFISFFRQHTGQTPYQYVRRG
ncbi:AraC family transcriptional regulator [Hahella sp. NBU794]|uniref:AraC family transcriptional regulator n=1 Tax=Hahella sp. NBU794 TaxID=3422590 RepID=UPI003D6FEB17